MAYGLLMRGLAVETTTDGFGLDMPNEQAFLHKVRARLHPLDFLFVWLH